MHVGILTPVYVPAPGGGAEYTRLLSRSLAARNDIAAVSVFTEAFPGTLALERGGAGKIFIRREFPHRAGRAARDVKSVICYGLQNLRFARLEKWLPSDVQVLLVHSSFHYHPNLLGYGLKRLRKERGRAVRLILDVRDPIMPATARADTEIYDDIICCSERAYDHITKRIRPAKPVHMVPMPFEPFVPSSVQIEAAVRKFGLINTKYLISTNGTSVEKGANLCLAVTERLRSRGHDLVLAIAGRRRDWGSEFQAADRAGLLRYLGIVPRKELLALVAGSAAHLNPSAIESPSRGSLEAIAAGARVLLPPFAPEFERCALPFVAVSRDPNELAAQVESILRSAPGSIKYPVHDHAPDQVAANYVSIFRGQSAGG